MITNPSNRLLHDYACNQIWGSLLYLKRKLGITKTPFTRLIKRPNLTESSMGNGFAPVWRLVPQLWTCGAITPGPCFQTWAHHGPVTKAHLLSAEASSKALNLKHRMDKVPWTHNGKVKPERTEIVWNKWKKHVHMEPAHSQWRKMSDGIILSTID